MSKKQPPKNPVSDEKGSFRVFRGGYWNYARTSFGYPLATTTTLSITTSTADLEL